MDISTSVDTFWSTVCSTRGNVDETRSRPIELDWNALNIELTKLDHSPQNFKASVGRSGALSNRRPPSRSSRANSQAASRKSSIESFGRFSEFANFEEFVAPNVVNIEVLSVDRTSESCRSDLAPVSDELSKDFPIELKKPEFSFSESRRLKLLTTSSLLDRKKDYCSLFHSSSTPLLNITNRTLADSHIILQNIKNSYLNLGVNKSNGYQSSQGSNLSLSDQRLDVSYRFPVFEKETYDNVESSSETEVIISDRESIADSGFINRKTVIKINEKSKSATSLEKEIIKPHWIRELQERRSLRASKDSTEAKPTSVNSDISEGINVSIKNKTEDFKAQNRDSTSRMYVRQSDCENRPTRASAFNVRRTIEKRQIQQERRERRALRDQLKEHLRSVSAERDRNESSSSSVSSYQSSSSARSKSLNSLNNEGETVKKEFSIYKVQSSPTLDSEKNELRTYLFGSNLNDASPIRSSKLVSRIMSPTYTASNQANIKPPGLLQKYICLKQFTDDSALFNKHTCSTGEVNRPFYSGTNSNSSPILKTDSSYLGESSQAGKGPNTQHIHAAIKPDILSSEYFESRAAAFGDSSKDSSASSPIPPPRRHSRVSRSTGQLTVEQVEKPAWLRLAKERRSLRSSKQLEEDFFDRASSVAAQEEPEWVARARRKLEAMNVCLTSTTDTVSVNSQVTESSSAWSRGGLDALEDLRDEVNRISEELSEEASEKVVQALGIADRGRGVNMIEYHKSGKSREASAERQKVSFDGTSIQNDKPKRVSPQSMIPKDEVKFGDLKHDWGGVQAQQSRVTSGTHKETRFGDILVKESDKQSRNDQDVTSESKCRKFSSENLRNKEFETTRLGEQRSVMHFGDTPQDIFSNSSSSKIRSQSSSKFESVSGPDPKKMTAEELNQNVEEYDFPIPTGTEDATDLITFLEESLNKIETVPEVVSNEDCKPKPKSILKRKSIENGELDIKTEEKRREGQQISKSLNGVKGDTSILDEIQEISIANEIHEDRGRSQEEKEKLKTKLFKDSFNPYQRNNLGSTKDERGQDILSETAQSREKGNASLDLFPKAVHDWQMEGLGNPSMGDNDDVHPERPLRKDDLFGRRSLREPTGRLRGFKKSSDSSQKPSPETKQKEIFHHEPKEVYLEIADKQRRSLPASLEKRKIRSSLFEWEAMQRQRIEDEERNRYNISLAVKPVSAKIKDLVKLHSVSTLRSIFSKDKRGEYNGTVDGKEDILFQKIPGGNTTKDPDKDLLNNPMKSPYIIQKILSPQKNLEKERLTREQPRIKGNLYEKIKIPESVERETYSFNQRKIYIDENDQFNVPAAPLPVSRSFTQPSLHGDKKDSLGKKKCDQVKDKIETKHKLLFETLEDTKKKSDQTCTAGLQKDKESASRHKQREWLNNMLNQLSNETHKSKLQNIKRKGDISFADDRSSIFRRSFHEYLPRKSEEKLEITDIKRSYDDHQTGLRKFKADPILTRDGARRLYEKKKDKERMNISTATDYKSEPSSKVSTPIMSPREVAEKNIIKDHKWPGVLERKTNFLLLMKEKENIRPVNEKNICTTDNKNSVGNIISNNQSKFDINTSRNVNSRSDTYENQPSYSRTADVNKLLERTDPSRSSVSMLASDSGNERCASPASLSDETHSVFDFSRESSPFMHEPFSSKFQRERTHSIRSASSVRSTPDRESRPVSLSSILERDVSSPVSSTNRLSISEELSEITQKYRKERASRRLSGGSNCSQTDVSESPLKQKYHFGMSDEKSSNMLRRFHDDKVPNSLFSSSHKGVNTTTSSLSPLSDPKDAQSSLKTVKRQVKESHIYSNKALAEKEKKVSALKRDSKHRNHVTVNELSRPRAKVVRRRSSLKKHRSGESVAAKSLKREARIVTEKSTGLKEKRKKKDSDTLSERYESVRQKPDGGWTKTSIRRRRLASGSSDKSSTRLDPVRVKRELSFKTKASKELENWAAGAQVSGKLVKKEGQRYSHQVEEEETGGKKTSKAISRRIVRRGSRRLSAGGEIVSETKEMASSGEPPVDSRGHSDSRDHHSAKSLVSYEGNAGNAEGVSRKIKTSTDGERYVTQSVHTSGKIKKLMTEGVDNKTTKSKEIIGGQGWEGERKVAGRHGERVIVEHSFGGRPSTVVKKTTTQSKVIITKTKKKAPTDL